MKNTVPLKYITTRALRTSKSTVVLVIWKAFNNSSTLGHMSALTTDESYLSFFYLIIGAGFWLKSHLMCFLLCKTWHRPQVTTAQLSSSENKQQIDQRMHWEWFGVHNASPVGLWCQPRFVFIPILRYNMKFWRPGDRQLVKFVFSTPGLSEPAVSHSPTFHTQPVALRTDTPPETHRWLKNEQQKQLSGNSNSQPAA